MKLGRTNMKQFSRKASMTQKHDNFCKSMQSMQLMVIEVASHCDKNCAFFSTLHPGLSLGFQYHTSKSLKRVRVD